jgi:alpha-galactosidase
MPSIMRPSLFLSLVFLGTAMALTRLVAETPSTNSPDKSWPTPTPAPTPAWPATLTPPAPATPRINGPWVFGVRSGSPVLYAIPATGERPMIFAAEGLPEGLALDASSGRITGSLPKAGTNAVTLIARNARGEAKRSFKIIVGDQIALTPPMGWNSWNCWGGKVSQEKVLSSARAMKTAGLDRHGWSYVNIDDGWQGKRGGSANAIQPNSKFPDMKSLSEQIHGMGLRFGIYSTPWRGSYEGHIGSSCDNRDGIYDWIESGDHSEYYRIGKTGAAFNQLAGGAQNEAMRNKDKEGAEVMAKRKSNWKFGTYPFHEQDAKQWAQWGVDYLKYDWNPVDVPHVEVMAKALRATGRDIVYSLSNSAPFKDAADWKRLANLWRTTGDINDSWKSMNGIGFGKQAAWAPYQAPGHYNDPDMLVIGRVGWGNPHPLRLTPDEQYTHVSLWCLLSAPLLLGCDLNQLDPFTLGLITNDEVLAIDQDELCKPALCVSPEGPLKVYVKELADGTKAIGLFNAGDIPAQVTLDWKQAGLSGKQTLRDLWRQRDVGAFEGSYGAEVPVHGVILLKATPVAN